MKRYSRIDFQDSPSIATPLNKVNLNKIDKGIDDLDNSIEDLYDKQNISNKRFALKNYKITNDNKYSAWPQDKCFVLNNVIYLLYNSGSNHMASDQLPYMRKSYDGGITWTDPIVMYTNPNPSTYVYGVTCWGAGTDGIRFFAVILLGGATNQVGSKKHILLYGNPEFEPSTWTQKEITLSKGGYVPNQYHSFAYLPEGQIAFGYDYMSGETGVAKSPDWGNTWTTHPIRSDVQNGNDLNNCEITFCVDGSSVIGFLRGEGRNTSIKPRFWKSTDSCKTFILEDAPDIPFETPIPIKRLGNKYYAFQSERTGDCKAYLLEANVTDVMTIGYSAFTKTYLGNLYYDGVSVGSGAGVASMVTLNNNLYIFYSSGNPGTTVDVFMMIIDFRQGENAILQSPNNIQRQITESVVLWANPNPTASFVAQTVTLSSNEFDELEFIYNTSSTSGRQSVKIPKGFSTSLGSFTPSGTNIYIGLRQATKVTDTSYVIGDALYGALGSSFAVDNAVSVPINVIGYRK